MSKIINEKLAPFFDPMLLSLKRFLHLVKVNAENPTSHNGSRTDNAIFGVFGGHLDPELTAQFTFVVSDLSINSKTFD